MSTAAPRALVIAEIGVNHDGDAKRAAALVDAAADAGADAVKFQTFRAESLASNTAPRAAYQKKNVGAGSQVDMLRALELPRPAFVALARQCAARKFEFMSTAFDEDSLAFLVRETGIRRIKIGSGDVTHAPLLLAAAGHRLPLLVSTGMCTLEDIEEALGVIAFGIGGAGQPGREAFRRAYQAGREALRGRVTLLHCVTEYPAPAESINLRAMDTLAKTFALPVGYSDHTLGIGVAIAAAARGATVIEKHLTLDRKAPGPDHAASLEPGDFATMVRGIRDAERGLGEDAKRPSAVEMDNRAAARRSLVAARAIRRGEAFSAENLVVKRPGTGAAPIGYWERLGRPAERDYRAEETIDP